MSKELLLQVKEQYGDVCGNKEVVRQLVRVVKDYYNPFGSLMIWNHSNTKPKFKKVSRVFRKMKVGRYIPAICRMIDEDIQYRTFNSERELILLLGSMYHIMNVTVMEYNKLSDTEAQLFLKGNLTGKPSRYSDDDNIIFSCMVLNGKIEYHYCC